MASTPLSHRVMHSLIYTFFKKISFIVRMNSYMHILECCDGCYYTGSTKQLELLLAQHQNGEGANHTEKKLPVQLIYVKKFDKVDTTFYRENKYKAGLG
ncbi:MAG: putative GIY-YIG superfamily endonuclease [Vicingaceae bacterium]|jgi:predicted GIY-YIG superfamily endonuclease